MSSFKDYQFQSFIKEALEELGFEKPTEIQQRLIPYISKGRNVVGQSQTGSGKTHAFLLPIINQLDASLDEVQAVITAPSRELATQIFDSASQIFSKNPSLRVMNFVGGTEKSRQVEKLKNQQPHLVIGTPGRILDLSTSGDLKLFKATKMVIDEADMTLDMGFLQQVDQIAGQLPKDLQMLVFSATIPEKLRPFLKKYMENPLIEVVESKTIISDKIDNWLISTKGNNKNEIIFQLLNIGHPYLAIVFANTKTRVDEIGNFLKSQGLKVAVLHGDIPPRERKRVMKQVQNLEYQYVVATDLAARGIDIEGVSHVINAEIPNDLEFFIHRVGRTGRANLEGVAITLFEPGEDSKVAELEKMGIQFHPKALQDGEIVDSFDRNRREKRVKSKDEMDTEMIGLVKKKKKKIKPGYKKKIEWAMKEKNKQKRKVERRSEMRKQRKNRKQTY